MSNLEWVDEISRYLYSKYKVKLTIRESENCYVIELKGFLIYLGDLSISPSLDEENIRNELFRRINIELDRYHVKEVPSSSPKN